MYSWLICWQKFVIKTDNDKQILSRFCENEALANGFGTGNELVHCLLATEDRKEQS